MKSAQSSNNTSRETTIQFGVVGCHGNTPGFGVEKRCFRAPGSLQGEKACDRKQKETLPIPYSLLPAIDSSITASVRSTSSSPCAVETNQASNCEGGR